MPAVHTRDKGQHALERNNPDRPKRDFGKPRRRKRK
jgi:hypothetical protein